MDTETRQALEALEAATRSVREAVVVLTAQGRGRAPWNGTQAVLVDLEGQAVADRAVVLARQHAQARRQPVYLDTPTDLIQRLDVAAMRYGVRRDLLLVQLLWDYAQANPDLEPAHLPWPPDERQGRS